MEQRVIKALGEKKDRNLAKEIQESMLRLKHLY